MASACGHDAPARAALSSTRHASAWQAGSPLHTGGAAAGRLPAG